MRPWSLPNELTQAIVDEMDRETLWKFATLSRACYEHASRRLYTHIHLPLPKDVGKFGYGGNRNIESSIKSIELDFSHPRFYNCYGPPTDLVRRQLLSLTNPPHLIFKQSSTSLSSALLCAMFRYLVEQDNLRELTWSIDYRRAAWWINNGWTFAWGAIHCEAFNDRIKSLQTLRLLFSPTTDALRLLGLMKNLTGLLLRTVKRLELNIGKPSEVMQADDLNDVQSPVVEILILTVDSSIPIPFRIISNCWPNVKSVDLRLVGSHKQRKIVSTNRLIRHNVVLKHADKEWLQAELRVINQLKYLKRVEMDWVYEGNVHPSTLREGVENLADKVAVDKLEEAAVKDELYRFTRLFCTEIWESLGDSIGWRYRVKPEDPEKTARYAIVEGLNDSDPFRIEEV